MSDRTSSRTSEGETPHCRICGSNVALEPSQWTREVRCPSCGSFYWDQERPEPIPFAQARAEYLMRRLPRAPMFGFRATLARLVERLFASVRDRARLFREPETSGVYDHWLDG